MKKKKETGINGSSPLRKVSMWKKMPRTVYRGHHHDTICDSMHSDSLFKVFILVTKYRPTLATDYSNWRVLVLRRSIQLSPHTKRSGTLLGRCLSQSNLLQWEFRLGNLLGVWISCPSIILVPQHFHLYFHAIYNRLLSFNFTYQ